MNSLTRELLFKPEDFATVVGNPEHAQKLADRLIRRRNVLGYDDTYNIVGKNSSAKPSSYHIDPVTESRGTVVGKLEDVSKKDPGAKLYRIEGPLSRTARDVAEDTGLGLWYSGGHPLLIPITTGIGYHLGKRRSARAESQLEDAIQPSDECTKSQGFSTRVGSANHAQKLATKIITNRLKKGSDSTYRIIGNAAAKPSSYHIDPVHESQKTTRDKLADISKNDPNARLKKVIGPRDKVARDTALGVTMGAMLGTIPGAIAGGALASNAIGNQLEAASNWVHPAKEIARDSVKKIVKAVVGPPKQSAIARHVLKPLLRNPERTLKMMAAIPSAGIGAALTAVPGAAVGYKIGKGGSIRKVAKQMNTPAQTPETVAVVPAQMSEANTEFEDSFNSLL